MKFPVLRLLVAVPAIASIALLSPACADAPPAAPAGTPSPGGVHADLAFANAHSPSKLDYLVFASLADSSRLPALAVRVGRPRD